jgi:O-antigen ligase
MRKSNIAGLRRTEMSVGAENLRNALKPLETRFSNTIGFAVAIITLLAIWLTTRPFIQFDTSTGAPPANNLINQITFAGLGVLGAVTIATLKRYALAPLLRPSYVLLLLWLMISVLDSTNPGISLRAFQFTAIVIFLAAATLVLVPNERQFANLLAIGAGLSLALAYFGVFFIPEIAIHSTADLFESENIGSWRGHLDHKNIAGALMGIFLFVGIYLMRRNRQLTGLAIVLASFVFLYFTKSKTSLAFAPLVVGLAFLIEAVRPLIFRLILALVPIIIAILGTFGSVVFEFVNNVLQTVSPGNTFTGRIDIWRYGIEQLAERPWTGYGFESFWQTSTTLYGETKLALTWDASKIVHGHNSYLDVTLTLGIPGLLLVLYVFVLRPILDYQSASADDRQKPLAHLFLMIWLFVSLSTTLESYYFRRSDPVWFSLLLAVFGMRFLAKSGLKPNM